MWPQEEYQHQIEQKARMIDKKFFKKQEKLLKKYRLNSKVKVGESLIIPSACTCNLEKTPFKPELTKAVCLQLDSLAEDRSLVQSYRNQVFIGIAFKVCATKYYVKDLNVVVHAILFIV